MIRDKKKSMSQKIIFIPEMAVVDLHEVAVVHLLYLNIRRGAVSHNPIILGVFS